MNPLSVMASRLAPALVGSLFATWMNHVAIASEPVTANLEGKQLIIRSGEREILRYQTDPGEVPDGVDPIYRRGGYIQAIRTPSGRLITDDFPPDHRHHHGIWSPWTKTEIEGRNPDFWNMGQGSGRVEFVTLDEVWEKDRKAGFTARHQFVDMSVDPEKTVLLETWSVTAWTESERHIIDFISVQECATSSPLKLPQYHYGGFGFRGNRAWNGAQNCKFLAASGTSDRVKINTSREPWCWIGGTVDGKVCGVTILCHPENFRFPQPVRAHPSEPFFCYAPQQLGEMAITPDNQYISRFRLIVADDMPDSETLNSDWKAYEERSK
jgi:hypothetical protein